MFFKAPNVRGHRALCLWFTRMLSIPLWFKPFIIMSALRSRCGHYIFALGFLLSSSSVFYLFHRLFSAVAALLHGTLVVGISKLCGIEQGRHLYLAGQPSRWALAHILVNVWIAQLDSQPFRSRANSLPGANRPTEP